LERHAEGELGLMNVTRIQLGGLAQRASKAELLNWAEHNDHFPVHRPVLQ
jgi:hypothetical protein